MFPCDPAMHIVRSSYLDEITEKGEGKHLQRESNKAAKENEGTDRWQIKRPRFYTATANVNQCKTDVPLHREQ
jgi:hypothetical protein